MPAGIAISCIRFLKTKVKWKKTFWDTHLSLVFSAMFLGLSSYSLFSHFDFFFLTNYSVKKLAWVGT